MKKAQIAAQLYTVRDFTKTEKDLDETLGKIKAIGYEAVQLSAVGPIEPQKVKELADKHGLKICATHISYDRLKDDLPKVIEEHQLWGCKYVGIGGLPKQFRSSKEGYVTFAKEFSEVGKKLKAVGLQFIYHNHKFEFENFEGKTGMEWLLETSDPQAFGFELDMYWVHAGGADAAGWARKVNGRMQAVHFKDMAILDNEQIFAEIGEGNMDYEAIIGACRDIGVEWYIVEQDKCQRDPFESLAISYAYLSKQAHN